AGVGIVASATLAGGVLSGKYRRPGASGRLTEAGRLDEARQRAALDVADRLGVLADSLGRPPASLAIAYALAHPSVASVLFGARSPQQVAENVGALEVLPLLDGPLLARLRSLGSAPAPAGGDAAAPSRTE